MVETKMPVKFTVRGQKINPEKHALAKEFRQNLTEAESILWQRLRRNQLGGWHFRQKQVIGGFIVDFYCHQANLIVEVDGPVHEQQRAEDTARDRILTDMGYRVLRVINDNVMGNIDTVLSQIAAIIHSGMRCNCK